MKRYNLLLYIFGIILLSGCSSDNNDPNPDDSLSAANQLISFDINSSLNSVSVNSRGTISGSNVTVFLPAGTERSDLIPEFTISDKAKMIKDGQEVISGNTSLDFSDDITLDIEAEDNSPRQYTITLVTNLPNLDVDVSTLMSSYNIPGVQLAIVKDEKLVYTKSYGLADKENGELISNESLFRIASISKTITAIAIFKLVDEGSIDLDDFVFGEGAILGTKFGTNTYPEDIKQITVRHLLEHTPGWTNDPFDPMFANLDYSLEELISDILDNRPLSTSPGSTYYYSNFGYCVLGRIIEEASGLTYEKYVNDSLLKPSSISEMKIAGNTLEDRYPNEVKYYDQENFSPYLMNVTRLDSPGGWIASATDLVQFLVHIDRNSDKSDLVNSSNLQELHFGLENWIFYGSLPGTSSAISRVNDSFGYAIIVNTRTIPINGILDEMNELMRDEILNRSTWPEYDLFGN